MATVVGLNRGTREHSMFKLPSLHVSLTINAKDDQEGNVFSKSSHTLDITPAKPMVYGGNVQLCSSGAPCGGKS